MANSFPSGVSVKVDKADGSTVVDISQYVLTVNSIDVESILEEMHSFGKSWAQFLAIGVGKMSPVEIGGLYDDTAVTGPDALFSGVVPQLPSTVTRTLTMGWNATPHTTSVETFLISYSRQVDRNALTKFKIKLQPTGTVTET